MKYGDDMGWEAVGTSGFSAGEASSLSIAIDSSIPYVGYRDKANEDKAAVLKFVPPTYTVTYNGNDSTDGTVPMDSSAYKQGVTVTVYGNTGSLAKTGYTFAGWNTAANGSGTAYAASETFGMGSANVTLYARMRKS